MFAVEHWDVRPDIITCAKGLSSGYLPLGAVLVHEKIYETFAASPKGKAVWHGYTNTGNPACCAAGVKTMEIMERESVVAHAEQMGRRMHQGLQALRSSPIVGDVRGLGMMAAVELVRDKQTREPFAPSAAVGGFVRDAAREEALLLRVVGDNLCLSPPLVITEQEMDLLLQRFTAALAKTEAKVAREGLQG